MAASSNNLGYSRRELQYKVSTESTAELRNFVLQNHVTENTEDVERLMKYELYWKFYTGEHWRAFNDTLLSFNYVGAFINKVNMFLIGDKPLTFQVNSLVGAAVPQELETALEALITLMWRKSKGALVLEDSLQIGSVTGDLFILLEYDAAEDFVRIKPIDSRNVYPEFVDGDITKLEAISIRMPLGKNTQEYRVLVRRFTKDSVETWYQKTLIRKPSAEDKLNYSRQDNPYSFIPIIHIQNKAVAGKYYGVSDARDILKINKMFNEKAQDMNDVIEYYGSPTTVITGASGKNLVKQLGNIWSGLPPEANVFNLGLGEDLNGSIQFLKDVLKTGMHEIGDVPENALGKIQAISNTSAAALQVTYQPLVQQANAKAARYGAGFTELNTMMLKMLLTLTSDTEGQGTKRLKQLLSVIKTSKELKAQGITDIESLIDLYEVNPVFSYGLPYDRMSDLQQADIETRLHVNSRRNIMNRLGIQDVPTVMQEAYEDAIRFQSLQNSLGDIQDNPLQE